MITELEQAFDEQRECPWYKKISNNYLYVKPHELAAKWAIGTNLAEATVKVITQKFLRRAVRQVDRRFCTRNAALKYNSLNCRFTSDTFFASTPSILRNTCAQLFMSDFGFGKFCPQKLKSEADFSLQKSFKMLEYQGTFILI